MKSRPSAEYSEDPRSPRFTNQLQAVLKKFPKSQFVIEDFVRSLALKEIAVAEQRKKDFFNRRQTDGRSG